MKKLVLITLMSSAAMFSLGAHAEGAYIGAALPTTHYNLGYLAPGASSTDDATGYKLAPKLFGGYDIDKTWSVEAGYAWLGKPSYGFTQNGVAGSVEAESRAFYVAGKATLPVNDVVSVFGKVGASDNRYTVSGSGSALAQTGKTTTTGLYLGVGAQYALTKTTALTLEYENFGKMAADGRRAGAITVGAKYNF